MNYKNNLSDETKTYLLNIIEKWQNVADKIDEADSIIFKNLKIDNAFIQKINEYNKKYMEIQIFYLNSTLKLAETKIEKEHYYEIIQKQVNNAIEWCNKYSVDVNKNSIYYKKI